ncbi:MAG: hypothetical protein WCY65_03450 [Candidatus Methanomethylophilaceae archaeon]
MADAEKSMRDGQKEMEKGDFKKAYSKFKKATEEDPSSAEAWFHRAEAGNLASGMFGAKIGDEDIMEAYKKAIELDAENTDYYSSYGSFCISIGKFEEAEGAYSEAAEMDESNASRYLAEFAVDYYNAVLARYGEIMDDPAARAPYAKKALLFMLKALEMEPEEAKKLL